MEGFVFDICIFAIDFTNSNLRQSKFTNSNLKTCIFRNADLTNAELSYSMLCSADFKGAIIEGTVFNDNYYHSKKLEIDDLWNMI